MNCPKCTTEMELGALEIHGPRFGFLFFGLSAPRHLFWTSEDGESELALGVSEIAHALRST